MEDLWTWSWRVYPATGLVLLGAGLLASGVRAALAGGQAWHGGPATALLYLFVFRRLAVGLAIAGLGVGWVGSLPWLVGASLCIGLGELLETSYYVGVVRWGQRRALVR